MVYIGTTAQIKLTVTEEYTAAATGSGLAPVFATPWMIALMENASASALQGFLEEGQGSVGTHVEVDHTAATPIGMEVTVEAEITGVSENGKMIDFDVRAWDETGPIGQGKHTRAIINNARFLAKCNAKLNKES